METRMSHWPCFHRAYMVDTCVFCNKSKIECGDPATIPFDYINPSLSLTKEAIHMLRNNDLQRRLVAKKLHIVLDLDHTLVHARKLNKPMLKETRSLDDVFEVEPSNGDYYWVKLRPGAREFINQASSMFDLSVYTMGSRGYANKVVEFLGGRSKFLRVISREDCTKKGQKNLDVVLSHQQVILIVDDTETVWEKSCWENLIKIECYNFFEGMEDMDGKLAEVFQVLKAVHSAYYYCDEVDNGVKDVREILKLLSSESVLGGGSQESGCLGQERYENQIKNGDEGIGKSLTVCGKRSRSDNVDVDVPYDQQNACVPTKRSNKLQAGTPRLVL